ncbi:MAG: hypothetical protein JWP31_278 [Aeromicrobium sp.]|nr:hypothetical protein [Aeromicrobium sp.]
MSSTGSTRGNPSMGDILRSMAVIALIILVVYGVGRFFTEDPGDPVEPVDYAAVVAQAAPAADFDLLAPASLPDGWRANVAQFEPRSWRLGVLTDDDEYIGLRQVRLGVDRAVDKYAVDSRLDGTADIAGQTWTVRTGPKDRTTYVLSSDGITTLVDSTTSRAVAERYIESLVVASVPSD